MGNKRIVATAPIEKIAIDILEQIVPVEISPNMDEETLLGMVEDTIAFVSRGMGAVTGRMIAGATELKVIGRPGAGIDTVDMAAATERKIPVVYAPVSGFAVAEGALAILMALVKRIPQCDEILKGGRWKERYEFKTGDMAGHTLGIVGFGRIGSHLAKLVQPFEMTVLVFDPYLPCKGAGDFGVEFVEFDELLARSDYVSLHVPLNDETHGLIDRDRIASMKKSAILINLARGDVIESLDVLAEALECGQLAAVGLDVFPGEPPDVSHRIFKNPHCLCAPHVLGASELAMERNFRSMATDMVAILQGRPPKFCVNPEVLA